MSFLSRLSQSVDPAKDFETATALFMSARHFGICSPAVADLWAGQSALRPRPPSFGSEQEQIACFPCPRYRGGMSDVTHILSAIEDGDPQAAEKLLPLVYDELRLLAAAKLSQEKPGQTLQATALVHEAYLRLVDREKVQHWDSRAHFFAAAAEAMRRVLVENARRKQSQKAGGDWQRWEFSQVEPPAGQASVDVLALSEALDRLEAKDARKAALVKLRFFVGMTNQEAAIALGISSATADNDWAYAKSWLRLRLADESFAD
jgi:RNA polymerase sigma factor (TIGR02999 family)